MAGSYELYFIRHAIAEKRGEAWPDDNKRPLSADGIARMRKNAKGLVKMGVTLDLVLTSPLVRARQTAEVVAAAFDARPSIVAIDSLSPGSSYQSLLNDLAKHSRRTRIALVGHETTLGEHAARLCGSRHAFPFKKGGVCRIDLEVLPPAGPGTLRWFATPGMLRRIR
ncbi:MAG TPA: phosphohistidine phosphatase SixA [Vicinamibacterales bacterium]|jgi:phosphohistidine phosphatase|nr:phosphohistidine phosphatase SixA [Vicinamibacterales bacterium]